MIQRESQSSLDINKSSFTSGKLKQYVNSAYCYWSH